MTVTRNIKGAHAAALLVLGISAIVGLFFMMVYMLDQVQTGDSSFVLKVVALVVGVSSALFILGLFLGYFYRNPKSKWLKRKKTRQHFQNALEFERGERIRLEKDLYEAKQTIAGLKDSVADLKDREEALSAELSEATAKQSEPPEPEETPTSEPTPDPAPEPAPEPPPSDEHLKELEALRKQYDQLQVDLSLRKARIADLLTEIALAQTEAEQARAEVREMKNSIEPQRATLAVVTEDASLKEVLSSVVELEGVRMAILSDDYGLVVETAGTDFPADKLAAVSSLLAQIGGNVEDIFAMGKVRTVSLGDESGFVLDNIYFDLFTLRCALTIARDAEHAYPGLAEETVEAIIARLQE